MLVRNVWVKHCCKFSWDGPHSIQKLVVKNYLKAASCYLKWLISLDQLVMDQQHFDQQQQQQQFPKPVNEEWNQVRHVISTFA